MREESSAVLPLSPKGGEGRYEPLQTFTSSLWTAPESPLGKVQRWMQAVIMHPEGVEAGLDSSTARDHINVPPEQVEDVISRSKALSSVERLSIYANAYYARLLECLGEEFPVLKQTLGEETFETFAFAYLQTYPSQSYTLNQLGANFAAFLIETRPNAADFACRRRFVGTLAKNQ